MIPKKIQKPLWKTYRKTYILYVSEKHTEAITLKNVPCLGENKDGCHKCPNLQRVKTRHSVRESGATKWVTALKLFTIMKLIGVIRGGNN